MEWLLESGTHSFVNLNLGSSKPSSSKKDSFNANSRQVSAADHSTPNGHTYNPFNYIIEEEKPQKPKVSSPKKGHRSTLGDCSEFEEGL